MKPENAKKIGRIIHRIKRQGTELPQEALDNFIKTLNEVVKSENIIPKEENKKVDNIDGRHSQDT